MATPLEVEPTEVAERVLAPHGWRNEILGEGIERLVTGRAALTFDRGAGLRLVDVPGD